MKPFQSMSNLWKTFAIQLADKKERLLLIDLHPQQSFIDG
jgi:hypothetical protein